MKNVRFSLVGGFIGLFALLFAFAYMFRTVETAPQPAKTTNTMISPAQVAQGQKTADVQTVTFTVRPRLGVSTNTVSQ